MTESIHTPDIDRMNEVALERRQEELCELLDGADIITVLLIVAEEMDLQDLIDSRIGKDLIHGTQSNGEQAYHLISEWARIDEELAQRREDD